MTRSRSRTLPVLAALAVAATLVVAAPPIRADALHHCASWTASRCDGSISVPVDRGDPTRGTIDVGFTWLPRADLSQPAAGTAVGAVGGPCCANDLALWEARLEPLLDRHNLLVMDYRGVGRSGALRCDALDRWSDERGWTPENVAACGEQLRDALPHYSTVAAADDLDDVRAALGVERIDLNGQSYGTFFAQVYALRHPEHIRTLVLDGVVPLDSDPWERPSVNQPLASMRQVCDDSALCEGDPVADWTALVDRTRQRGGDVTVEDLRNLQRLFGGLATGRELIAAARAALRGDDVPLRRLIAHAEAFPDAIPEEVPEPSPDYSPAQGFAITCNDDPMPFERATPAEIRRVQFDAARDALPADSYAPFTVTEATANLSRARLCVDWPTPGPATASPAADSPHPDVPTLVVSGSLDSATPPQYGQRTADRFPHSRHIVISFGEHSAGLYGPDCAGALVTEFMATADLGALDPDGCTDTTFRALGAFPRRLRDIEPADGDGSRRARRLAAAAIATVADAAARRAPESDRAAVQQDQPGLRGGSLRFTDDAVRSTIDLDDTRYVEDVVVNGTVIRDLRDGTVTADVTLQDGRGRDLGQLDVSWDATTPDPTANATGRIIGHPLTATAGAP